MNFSVISLHCFDRLDNQEVKKFLHILQLREHKIEIMKLNIVNKDPDHDKIISAIFAIVLMTSRSCRRIIRCLSTRAFASLAEIYSTRYESHQHIHDIFSLVIYP